MRTAIILATLFLSGCATPNEVERLSQCRNDTTCATSVPGSGYGPPHQAATGSTTGQTPLR